MHTILEEYRECWKNTESVGRIQTGWKAKLTDTVGRIQIDSLEKMRRIDLAGTRLTSSSSRVVEVYQSSLAVEFTILLVEGDVPIGANTTQKEPYSSPLRDLRFIQVAVILHL